MRRGTGRSAAGTAAETGGPPPRGFPSTEAPAGLEDLFAPVSPGVRWGLEKTRSMLAATGDPHLRYPVLHVGGTNGKGSTAAMCARVLRAHGLRVGLYTSPHLTSFRERFQVDGSPVEDALLEEVADGLVGVVRARSPSFFEATTVLGFLVFYRCRVDVAVVEVGLGGRLDATNVVVPAVSAITNVALDHADYLGGTLAEIAREKAGIVKPGVPLVTAETDPRVLRIFREVAARRRAPLHPVDPADVRDLTVDADGTRFVLRSPLRGDLPLETPLIGEHQAANAALAVRMLEALPPEIRPDRGSVLRGIREVRWPGRMQIERLGGRTWIFDVAHNTAGVHAMARTLSRLRLPGRRILLVGILGDKDWHAMLPPLFGAVDGAVLTQPPSAVPERRWDPGSAVREVAPPPVTEIVPDFGSALERAASMAAGGTVVVTGSHHTVGDALRELGLAPFALLPAVGASAAPA